MENYNIERKLDEILSIVKRSETKQSHAFKAQGINITDKPFKDNVLNKIFIERDEENSIYIIRVLHEDVTIRDIKKFLENKTGEFIVISGEDKWKIQK